MKIRIKKERAIIFLLVLASLNLASYDHMGGAVSLINNSLRALAFLGAGYMFLKKRAGKVSPLFLLLLFMRLELLISTLIKGGSLGEWAVLTCDLLAHVFIFEAWSQDIKELVFALMPLMELLCYANYLTVLLFPKGMYFGANGAGWSSWANWLLGYRTGFITYLLPACVIAFLYRQYGGKRWRMWGVYIVSFITVVLPPSRSATSAIGMVIFFIMLFLIHRGFKFNVYCLAGVNVTLFFMVVIFRMQEVFLGPVGRIFGKNIDTLSSRTLIWDNLFPLLKTNPLLGCGVQSVTGSAALLKFSATGAHNLILHYLYQGGALQLALYFGMVIIIYRHLRKAQTRIEAQALGVALFAVQVMGLTEVMQGSMIFIIYYFSYFVKQISAETVADSRISICGRRALENSAGLQYVDIDVEKSSEQKA